MFTAQFAWPYCCTCVFIDCLYCAIFTVIYAHIVFGNFKALSSSSIYKSTYSVYHLLVERCVSVTYIVIVLMYKMVFIYCLKFEICDCMV